MKPIETVWSVVNEIMATPKFVRIDFDAIDRNVAGIQEFNKQKVLLGPRFKEWAVGGYDAQLNMVWYDLIASSVNYMFWYGSGEIRPGGSNSVKMYRLLDAAFQGRENQTPVISRVIEDFADKLVLERFPHSETRYRHLMEIMPQLLEDRSWDESRLRSRSQFVKNIAFHRDRYNSIEEWVTDLILLFPNFGQDIFLKRAFLFFGLLNRRYGWFADIIKDLPIPADYHIPKMLRWLGCLEYSAPLADAVDNDVLIPAGSRKEVEIRAASLMACDWLAEKARCSMTDVDAYLWTQRKASNDKIHLTITTDY